MLVAKDPSETPMFHVYCTKLRGGPRDTSNDIWIWPHLGKGRNGAEATLVCWGPESSDTCPFRTQESQPEVPGDGGAEVKPCSHKPGHPGPFGVETVSWEASPLVSKSQYVHLG